MTVHNHLRTIQVLLDRPMPSPSRREMESAAATTATLAGIIAILIRQHHDAAIYLELGERFAERAGDTEVLVLAMMFTSFLYSAVSPGQLPPDPPRAMAVLEAADRLVSPHTAPIARAWLQLRHAGEYAWCGDERGAFRLLDEAERLGTTAQIPPDGLCSGWTRDTHVAFRGEIATMCGRHDQAIALLESALAALGPNSVATRARALVQLGSAHAEKGDVDHACDLLSRALDLARTAALSERIAWIASVRSRYLACHESEPAVARLDEQLEGGRAG